MFVDYKHKCVPAAILGESHELYASNRVMREVSYRYGGLKELGEVLEKNDFTSAKEIVWLLTALANEGAAAHNINHPDDRRGLLDPEAFDMLITDGELETNAPLAVKALNIYYGRDITPDDEPEGEPKNPIAG